jgi:mannose-1-phosphate guanylyltransferase/phosphomannomutase
MFASMKLLEALSHADLRLRDVADRFPPAHVMQARIACPWSRKGAVMRRLIEATEGEERQLVDGVKVWTGEKEWVLVIPHSHKAYFVVTAEGSNPRRAAELLRTYSGRVEKWRDEG